MNSSSGKNFISRFYERNLFERIVLYLFMADFLVKIIFELALGESDIKQSQNIQWAFYFLLALDYLISVPKVINIRVTVNPMSILAFVFFIMVAHGLFVGLMNHNSPFVILNDTVPPLMIALNILRMQSSYENKKPVDMRFLLNTCTFMALCAVSIGFIASPFGVLSKPLFGSGVIYFPILMSSLFVLRPFPKWVLFAATFMLGVSLGDFNRTTMLFLLIISSGYLAINFVRNPVKGGTILLVAAIVVVASVSFLPDDSKTYRRITSLSEIDLTERTGSIGERQAEWDAIQIKLAEKGKTIEWFGLGFGGVYNVQFTHQYLVDYGHAHYAWAWFNLRFGKSGYIYMVMLMAALLYNMVRGGFLSNRTGIFVSFLCLQGFIYCFTHVNSVFLLSGLHFFHVPNSKKEDPELTHTAPP